MFRISQCDVCDDFKILLPFALLVFLSLIVLQFYNSELFSALSLHPVHTRGLSISACLTIPS
jgi:hypothetical protein